VKVDFPRSSPVSSLISSEQLGSYTTKSDQDCHIPSATGRKRQNAKRVYYACFSNRPFGVKRFQTIHHHSVDVAHGLVLLFGIGAKALPVWDSKTRRNNLSGGLAVSRRQNQADMRTHLIHRPARDIFHCSVELGFPPIELILWTPHAAAASLVQRNSVPSTHMRCMITANRRAKATIAFFIPRRLAICMAQALSHDHFFERSMLCAAS